MTAFNTPPGLVVNYEPTRVMVNSIMPDTVAVQPVLQGIPGGQIVLEQPAVTRGQGWPQGITRKVGYVP